MEMITDIPDWLEVNLNVVGWPKPARKSLHGPVAHPKPKLRPDQLSKPAWLPTDDNQEPPF